MFGSLGFQEMIIIGGIAVLLFGKRLPEVARSLGSSYQQFRRGLQDLQGEFNAARYSYDSHDPQSASRHDASVSSTFDQDDYDQPTAPKIALPTPEVNNEQSQGE